MLSTNKCEFFSYNTKTSRPYKAILSGIENPHTITEPPPNFEIGLKNLGCNALPGSRQYHSLPTDPRRLILVSSDHTTFAQSSADHDEYFLAKAKRSLKCLFVSSGIFTLARPFNPADRRSMMAAGVGKMHKLVGTMTAKSYVDILCSDLPATAEKFEEATSDIVFQLDNDPKYTAKLTKKWLSDNGYHMLEWPTQSPDLNPIEQLLGILNRGVVGIPSNLEELWTNAPEAWDNIDPGVSKNLVDSRIDAAIKAKGGYTKY